MGIQIGEYTLDSNVLLAPMAGITDVPFRKLCRQFGAGLATTEMVTSDVRLWHTNKSKHRLRADTQLTSIQIAGSDPDMLAEAAKEGERRGAHIIDINMGCPAKKVCKRAAGSALMRDEKLVASILQSVTDSVNIPVTLKTRTGWDTQNKNCVRIAKLAEETGIAALTVHGRTRACRFTGQAEYDTIASVVQSVSIPVIANGDIDCGHKAREVLEYTGAAAVMIGRAALGRPWIFNDIVHFLKTGDRAISPSWNQIQSTVVKHLNDIHKFYGDRTGVKIARKHFNWYGKQLELSKTIRKDFNYLESTQSQLNTVLEFFGHYNNHEEKVA